jgi:hypothetical protein
MRQAFNSFDCHVRLIMSAMEFRQVSVVSPIQLTRSRWISSQTADFDKAEFVGTQRRIIHLERVPSVVW